MMTRPRAQPTMAAMSQNVVQPRSGSAAAPHGSLIGWLFFLGSMFWPRAGILTFWIFSDLLGKAYGSAIVPIVGFFVLPWTTLTYAMMWGWSSDKVFGFEWFFVAIALMVDIITYLGWRSLRS